MARSVPQWIFRHPRVVRLFLAVCCVFLVLAAVECFLRLAFGLGNPILYDTSPLYGYRPLADQTCRRFGGARVSFNNLSLRTAEPWDSNPAGKILFLGDSVTYGGSSIDDGELFSTQMGTLLPGYDVGNAGVNGWGIENIHGLIVDSGFTPAQVYVTVVPTGDFFRGMTRCQGMPYSNRSPRWALRELWWHFCLMQNNRRYLRWVDSAGPDQIRAVAEKAVLQLKEMDTFLKSRGYIHILFLTPSLPELNQDDSRFLVVLDLIEKHGLAAVRISEELGRLNLSASQAEALYTDGLHLSKEGHRVWAGIIAEKLKQQIGR